MKLIELKKTLPYTYEVISRMFKIVWLQEEKYNEIDIKENDWFMQYEWTDKQQEEFKNWLYRKLRDNKNWRKEIMKFPIKNKNIIDKVVNTFILDYWLKIKQE